MKNCVDCVNMRVRIPVIDGAKKRQVVRYNAGIARCIKGMITSGDGKEKQFRMYGNHKTPRDWDNAKHCKDYYTDDKIVSSELADVIVKAYRSVYGK